MNYIILVAAIVLITVAHLIRAYRWGLFISVYEHPRFNRLIKSMTLGYIVNHILPFKLGDLFRAYYASKKMKNGKALAFSTVIVDRVLDIMVVGLIFLILSFGEKGIGRKEALFYILATVFMLALVVLAYIFKDYVKKLVIIIARIFNSEIEGSVLKFSFALISNFKDIFRKINVGKLILSTASMWGLYILSYYVFSIYLTIVQGQNIGWTDVFVMFFSQSSIISSTGRLTFFWESNSVASMEILLFSIVPLALLWLISFAFNNNSQEGIASVDGFAEDINLLPHIDNEERLAFLEMYFAGKNREYIENYLDINRGISIIRDYSAGSNATTMLCMNGADTFFRKYAFSSDGNKLYEQICWIEDNQDNIKLPTILRKGRTGDYCYYDMPYDSHAVGMFEYVHTIPIDKSWKVLQDVLEQLEGSIYQINKRKADRDTVDRYIDVKVLANLDRITKSKRIISLSGYDKIIINGVEYDNLSSYMKYFDRDFLREVFINDDYSVIHGDLTIENIICIRDSDGKDDFYIIDPNTGNIHDSANLDYGKLLQSIHGGYEFLMATKEVVVDDNRINFIFTKSSAYIELLNRLKEYMNENFDEDRVRSIYFHEIVNWLRLLPYKLEKDEKRAVLFYAGLLMILKDLEDMYGEE